MNSLVSIIIPNFNRGHLISETLDSLLDQSYENWECIIVDDHSTDNSIDIVKGYCNQDNRFTYYLRPSDRLKGQCACRNVGYEYAKGSYVNWFDSDDIMHKDFIKTKVEFLENNVHLDVVISQSSYFIDNINNITFKESRTRNTDNIFEKFISKELTWYMPDPMWRNTFLDNKNLFNEKLFAGGVDREFHTRMLLFNPSLKFIEKNLTYCRLHNQNISTSFYSNKNIEMKKLHFRSTQKLIKLIDNNDRLTNKIKTIYFIETIRYLPYLYKNNQELTELISLLRRLNVFNISVLNSWIRFILALVSFKLTNRGTFLLEKKIK